MNDDQEGFGAVFWLFAAAALFLAFFMLAGCATRTVGDGWGPNGGWDSNPIPQETRP